MPNHSEIEQILTNIAFSDGLKIGAKIREEFTEGILAGTITMPLDQPINVDINITDFFQYKIPIKYQILAKLGSPFVMSTRNTGLAVGGGAILLKSGKNLLEAGNYMNNIGESVEGKRRPRGFGINRFLP
jgi:hypothetical protein